MSMGTSRMVQETARHISVGIIELQPRNLHKIRLPSAVHRSVFESSVEAAVKYNTHEGKPTGCILVLGDPEELQPRVKKISLKGSDLLGESIQNPGTESRLRESFSADGMMVIDGRTGEILAANSQVEWKSSPFVLEGHGTRHDVALQIAAELNCITITRSKKGYVTVFSSQHLGHCFRLRDERSTHLRNILVLLCLVIIGLKLVLKNHVLDGVKSFLSTLALIDAAVLDIHQGFVFIAFQYVCAGDRRRRKHFFALLVASLLSICLNSGLDGETSLAILVLVDAILGFVGRLF